MRSNKRITIADIAQKAGVSKQTVSRVINDKPDVAPQTRRYIQNLIKTMGYAPDPIARSMKGNTYTLGCISPNFSDANISTIIQAIQNEARKSGFFTLVASANSEIDFNGVLNEMVNRRVDGLLVINPRDDNRYRYLLPHVENGLPIVYIKNTPVNEAVSAISLDDEHGGFLATQHLLSLGHTTIVTILGPENEECVQNRLRGYKNALQSAGICEDPRLILYGDWSADSGKAATRRLISYNVRFSAIFAQNDWLAMGAMLALRDAGYHVPRDVSVIGFDDLPMAAFYTPPLTSVQQPREEFGAKAAQVLIDHIRQPGNPPQIIKLTPTLIIRESCAPINSTV